MTPTHTSDVEHRKIGQSGCPLTLFFVLLFLSLSRDPKVLLQALQYIYRIQQTLQTLHIDTSNLLLHGTRIYLAHVTPFIRLPDLFDAQSPGVHVFVDNTNSIVMCDNTALQCQNRLIRRPKPANL